MEPMNPDKEVWQLTLEQFLAGHRVRFKRLSPYGRKVVGIQKYSRLLKIHRLAVMAAFEQGKPVPVPNLLAYDLTNGPAQLELGGSHD